MIGLRFDILALMHLMNAVGLMPDDIYREERERLTRLIAKGRWESDPLKLNTSGGVLTKDEGSSRFLDPAADRELEPVAFDWRVLIADYLESAYDAAHRSYRDRDLRDEFRRLGVQPRYELPRSGVAYALKLLSTMELQQDERKLELNASHHALASEVSVLRSELAELRARLDGTSRDTETPAPPQSAGGIRSRSRPSEIAELQRRMAQCLSFAVQHEAKGEFFAAGNLRGEATRIESELRALGA